MRANLYFVVCRPRRKGVERRSPSPKTTKGTSLRNSTELRSSIDNSGETGQQHQDRLEELRLENERIIRETERMFLALSV
jgi:hypothetical protein